MIIGERDRPPCSLGTGNERAVGVKDAMVVLNVAQRFEPYDLALHVLLLRLHLALQRLHCALGRVLVL